MNAEDRTLVRQPLLLSPNRKYPAYQLAATAGSGRTTPEDVLKIAVLETAAWLRQRFRAFKTPEGLELPAADRYEEISLDSLRSFDINEGYKLVVVWLPQERNWTLQLTEPDLGSHPGEASQERQPVPGRLLETNIAYRIEGAEVACGFRTIIAEPDGTTAPCEVYRLAVIKHLARNPLVGLRQGLPLLDTPHLLHTDAEMRRACDWLLAPDRTLPGVVTAESVEEAHLPPAPVTIDELLGSSRMRLTFIPPPEIPQQEPKGAGYLLDVNACARYRSGYAHFLQVPYERLTEFCEKSGIALSPGEALFWEPAAFGGEIRRWAASLIRSDEPRVREEIDEAVREAPLEKPMVFGPVLFVHQAIAVDRAHVLADSQNHEVRLKAALERTHAIEETHREDQLHEQRNLRTKDAQIAKLKEQLEDTQSRMKRTESRCAAEIERQRLELAERERTIEWLRSRDNRPRSPDGVAAWVAERFADRLHFHSRAVDLMKSVKPGDIDLPLLCDALEYLAVEYRDELLGLITEDERNAVCSRKYERPFDVTPVKGASTERYASEYEISYDMGGTGKTADCPLNLHLRIGNTSLNLIRIYFLYDPKLRLIIVGSLPWHLSTMSYH